MPSRAIWLEGFNPPQYFTRLHLRSVGRRIPRSDAKWLATILARLSPERLSRPGLARRKKLKERKIVERRIDVLSDI
jgi:hypothetical protein